jgi:hypothetical protein
VNTRLIERSIHLCLWYWGGHIPPNAVGGLLCLALGTLLYNQHNTKHTTHTRTQHTPHNTRWAAAALPSSGLLPSNPTETSATPPTLGAADPLGSGNSVIHWLRSRRFSLHCLGAEMAPIEKERGGQGIGRRWLPFGQTT